MKKFLSLAFVLVAVFCLAGCGNKPATLVCSQKVSSVNVEITAKFTGNKVNDMSMKYLMDLSNYSDTVVSAIGKQDYCSTVSKAMSQFTLVGCTQSVENKVLTVKSGIDISKLNLKGAPTEVKSTFEGQGYTCTLQ